MEINMELLTKEEINNNKFYFLSDKGDFKRIYPRVPRRRMNYEDNETKRICCAKRIYSVLQAIPLDKCCDFYVYQLDITKKTRIARPDLKDVLDSGHTHELWCLSPVNLIKIGKIRITSFDGLWKYVPSPWKEGNKCSIDVNKNITYFWSERYGR